MRRRGSRADVLLPDSLPKLWRALAGRPSVHRGGASLVELDASRFLSCIYVFP